MQKIVLDSDIIIDYTRAADPLFGSLLNQYLKDKIKLFIPSIVLAELMSGKETKQDKKLRALENLIGEIELVVLDYNLSVQAGFLVRDNQPIQMADAIVAATALSLNAKLVTRNKKHFEGIKDLKFFKAS